MQPMVVLAACALAALASSAAAAPLAKGITFSRTVNQHSESDGPLSDFTSSHPRARTEGCGHTH